TIAEWDGYINCCQCFCMRSWVTFKDKHYKIYCFLRVKCCLFHFYFTFLRYIL
ncbi:hypothetical protein BDF20DRAFT_841188, partial [Mycotypha africana]|uniref:uncharacterized protein n=2 Tax=Mycotypha africana TaxID=64632 RepID=UPI002300F244